VLQTKTDGSQSFLRRPQTKPSKGETNHDGMRLKNVELQTSDVGERLKARKEQTKHARE
jgi:hypothetical protein